MKYRRPLLAALYAVAIATLLTGCGSSAPAFGYEYRGVLNSRVGSKTVPIAITMRFDRKDRNVTTRARLVFPDGVNTIATFEYHDCDVSDDQNFSCTDPNNESLRMTDGKLTVHFEKEKTSVQFTRHYVIFGHSL
jgi:hypothetical protein